jgi:hypothetical protein
MKYFNSALFYLGAETFLEFIGIAHELHIMDENE